MDLQGCIFSVFSLLPSLHSDQSSFFLPSALPDGALSILQNKGCPIFMLTSGNLEPNAGLGLVEGQRGHTHHTECLTQIWPRVQIRDELQQGRNPYTSTSQREHPKVTMVGGKHCWGILGHLPHLQWPACSLQHQPGSKPPGMPCSLSHIYIHTHTHRNCKYQSPLILIVSPSLDCQVLKPQLSPPLHASIRLHFLSDRRFPACQHFHPRTKLSPELCIQPSLLCFSFWLGK